MIQINRENNKSDSLKMLTDRIFAGSLKDDNTISFSAEGFDATSFIPVTILLISKCFDYFITFRFTFRLSLKQLFQKQMFPLWTMGRCCYNLQKKEKQKKFMN